MISAELNQTRLPPAKRLKKRVVQMILYEVARRTKAKGTISVVFVSGSEIRKINRQYRHKDKVTDVLAFEAPLYEILICHPQAKRQAAERGHTVGEEVIDLLIHGVLHVFGYDHQRPKDAKVMLPLQKKIYETVTHH